METQSVWQVDNKDIDNAFLLVCIIATLNKIISSTGVKEDSETIKVNKNTFITVLNDIAETYHKNFHVVSPRLFDPNQSIELIKSRFSDFVEVTNNVIVIDPGIENFQETFSRLAFSIVSSYIQRLIHHAEQLGQQYKQLGKGEKMEASEQKENNLQNKTEPANELDVRDFSPDSSLPKVENKEKFDDTTQQKKSGDESQPEEEYSQDLITEEPSHTDHDVDVPESTEETSSNPKKTRTLSHAADQQQQKRFQNIAVNLIYNIESHRFSSPFLQPVNTKEEEDYLEVVYEPKDLKSILKAIKLKNDPPEYFLMQDLKRDIMLMLANCIMYNKSDSDLVELTRIMKNDILNTFKVFEDAES